MVSIDNLTVEFSAKPLFTNVSFVINDKDRIALVGKNGAGKSTMLKISADCRNRHPERCPFPPVRLSAIFLR